SLPLSFYPSVPSLNLHPFPTRRSSDLQFNEGAGLQLDSLVIDHGATLTRRLDHLNVSVVALPLNAVQELATHNEVRYISADRPLDRKSTRLNSSHVSISYAVFCLKKKK